PLGGRGPGAARRLRRRPGDRMHIQVPERRARRTRVPLRAPRPAAGTAAAGLGLVRAAGPVRHGPGLPPGPQHRPVPDRHAAAGIDRLRAKAVALTRYLIGLADAWLARYGVTVASPRQDERRGAHVTLTHPEAWRISQALIRRGVIGDYRTPDRLRLGPVPVCTCFTDVWDALDILRQILADQTYLDIPQTRSVVT